MREADTRLQQRLKGHLTDFRREVANTQIKDRPRKSDEEICKDLSSAAALEMRSFRGSEQWLSDIAAALEGIQILGPRWDVAKVEAVETVEAVEQVETVEAVGQVETVEAVGHVESARASARASAGASARPSARPSARLSGSSTRSADVVLGGSKADPSVREENHELMPKARSRKLELPGIDAAHFLIRFSNPSIHHLCDSTKTCMHCTHHIYHPHKLYI